MSQSAPDHRRRGPVRFARLALVGALTASALVIVPAAQADSLSSARHHIRNADAALHKVVAGASNMSVSTSLAALEAELGAAGKDTAKLVKHAHTNVVRIHAASALTKLAAQEARDATVLTPIVGSLTGSQQVDIASLIASVTQGREQALSIVTSLLGKLPVDIQGQVAGVVAQLSNLGTGQVGSLAGAISPGSVACPAIDAVSQVVASVLASIPADLSRVTSILSFLPDGAATQLTSIVNGLPTQLNSLVANLKSAFNCSGTTSVAGLTGLTGLAGVSGSDPTAIVGSVLSAVTSLVQSILGSLPVVGSGQATSPVGSVTGPVSGLLGQITSLVPGLGSLFGGSGGLGGLLGGIL
jgi:hypothetical protein